MQKIYLATLIFLGTLSSAAGTLAEPAHHPVEFAVGLAPDSSGFLAAPIVPYFHPLIANSNTSLPSESGYVDGYPQEFTDGRSSLKVDNSQNQSDVLVKLFTSNRNPEIAVRVFLIRAHESFTVENIRAGSYEIRYRDLSSNALSRSDSFELQEFSTPYGIQFTQSTLTLYGVDNGNMQMHDISEADF